MQREDPKVHGRLFLIDGYALIYRAYFAMISRPLLTSRGENTSAVFGFTRFLAKILREHDPDYLGVVFDAGTSEREELYPEYKATREKMPDDLRASLPRIRQVLAGFRVPVLELPDHEADDVIGTLAARAAESGLETVIVSGDKDFLQLVGSRVRLLNPGRGGPAGVDEEWVDTHNVTDRLGVPADRVVDYLALIGDSSDNIPGARGIGPKTARDLIQRFGPVESVLESLEDITGKRARTALTDHAEDVVLSKKLVTIRTDLPMSLDLDALRLREPARDELRQVLVDLEFFSLARELTSSVESDVSSGQFRLIGSVDELEDVVGRARENGAVSLRVKGTSQYGMRASLVGLSLGIRPGEAYYIPLAHRPPEPPVQPDREPDLFGPSHGTPNLPPLTSDSMRPLRELLMDDGVPKIGHDLKYDLLVLRRAGVELGGVDFDTMLASYVLDPGRREYAMDALALQFLDHRMTSLDELCGKGKDRVPIAECDLERFADYACDDADACMRLARLFRDELQRAELYSLFYTLEVPLLTVLADMEWAGIGIDCRFFDRLSGELADELRNLEEAVYKLAGGEFNINSTPQLREVLYDQLQLPVVRRTKSGPSTDAAVLEELADRGHELPGLLLEYRKLDKLKGTYVDALPRLVHPDTQRIHTSFNQAVAATGRLSSSEPNLQNIPVRTQLGAELRKGFVAAEDHVFLAADYSQIELRILAHLSGDDAFLEAFRQDLDIHRQTAAFIFGVPVDQVEPAMRDMAKTINFATIYGIGAFALGRRLGISRAAAEEFIDTYFGRFPGVRRYLDEQIAQAREHGFVQTLSGRRRYIPELHSPNYNVRQFGERAATNAPVQGTAADIIKTAMIHIQKDMKEQGFRSRMLLQVHDELVFEVPESELSQVRGRVVELMENALSLRVPLRVSTGVGRSWWECKQTDH